MAIRQTFSTVLTMSLTASVVICFVLVARFVLKKAPKIFSYCLWAVVLFRLLCPVSVSSVFSVLHLAPVPQVVSYGTVSAMRYDAYPNLPEPEDMSPAPEMESPPLAASNGNLMGYAVILWLAGMGIMLLFAGFGSIRLLRQLTGAVKLGRNIYIADHIPTAFVLGLWRPRIYLPSSTDASEHPYIIAHEQTHIRRGDHILRLAAYFALCLHWFNPLVWLAFCLSGRDMEMSCDEAVIRVYGPKIRAAYSQCLLCLSTGGRRFPLMPLAFGQGDTKGRVRNMANWKKPGLLATILALILSISVLAACGMNPTQPEEPEILLKECREGMEALLKGNYHLRTEKLVNNEVFRYFRSEEWKQGENYMSRSEDVRADGSTQLRGSILRDGVSYSLQWENHDVTKPVILWENLRYLSRENFLLWAMDYELYDFKIERMTRDGNTITAWMKDESDSRFDTETIAFTFDETGRLRSAVRTFLQKDGTSTVMASVEVLDTPDIEIGERISAQDVSNPMVFSYTADLSAYPHAQTSGFRNTDTRKVRDMEDALTLADRECTMEVMEETGAVRYNMVQVFYDPSAGIWKVRLTYSQSPESSQSIYLNDQGITQRIVTG